MGFHRHIATCLLFCAAAAGAEDYRFPIGERATYGVHWGLLSCGTVAIGCDRIETNGQALVRIRIRAKSNWLVSAVYPVDDTVDCYIDPVAQRSVRLEKTTTEGGFVCKDVLLLDRASNVARWTSESQNMATNYPIAADTCDAVSFLYAFRRQSFDTGQSRDFNIAVDAAVHGVTILAKEIRSMEPGGLGPVPCRRFVAAPKRDGLFVRKIPKDIWITEDARKILARMDVKVPIGKVRIELEEYRPPGGSGG